MRWVAAALLLLSACTDAGTTASLRPMPAMPSGTQQWVSVLVAGDASLPVFDNATAGMQSLLRASGSPAPIRFSAQPHAAGPSAQLVLRRQVLSAIAGLQPGPGQACLVYMTSHGAHGPGVYLAPRTEFISPTDLDRALQAGCATAPTVAIVSACYTGNFAAPPMARVNRIILTAARADRPSFGCGAGRDLTVYDACLLQSLGAAPRGWPQAIATTNTCVSAEEQRENETPSEPQSFIGRSVARLPALGG